VDYEYLIADTIETLEWSLVDRIRSIWEDGYIEYARANYISKQIDELLKRPKTLRPQNLALIGCPGNGKSALMCRYKESHSPTPKIYIQGQPGNGKSGLLKQTVKLNPRHSELPAEIIPVLYVTAPIGGGEGRLLSWLLREIGYVDWDLGTIDAKWKRVLNALSCCKVQLVIVDDIQNMLVGGKRKFEALYAIRNISNCLGIPAVFAGSEEVQDVFEGDTSLTTRLQVLELPLWRENHDFRQFLVGIQATLSLKKNSHLYEKQTAHRIFDLTKLLDPEDRPGILVNILKLVKSAAVEALRNGSEQVTIKDLDTAADRCAWRAPTISI
jgi:hypothetical protein